MTTQDQIIADLQKKVDNLVYIIDTMKINANK